MSIKANFYKHTLNFKFDAGTSRGVLKNKDSFFLKITNPNSDFFGIGEAGPLFGLSPEFGEPVLLEITKLVDEINSSNDKIKFIESKIEAKNLSSSLQFCLEMAYLDYCNQGKRLVFNNRFFNDNIPIDINGLIWMGSVDFMKNQIDSKISQGFKTLKLKIGALDFSSELKILEYIRTSFGNEIELRVDANGAFDTSDAQEKLSILSEFNLHSIEQPIAQGQIQKMAELCENSSINIALDEELIGIKTYEEKYNLLFSIKPAYIILKPSLMGGFYSCNEWISIADELKINWWITSALESNIGLNAICQYTAQFNNSLPHGLGTGQLYHNNIESPLEINQGKIFYNKLKSWDIELF